MPIIREAEDAAACAQKHLSSNSEERKELKLTKEILECSWPSAVRRSGVFLTQCRLKRLRGVKINVFCLS